MLILDEPTSGLDPQGTVEMRALIGQRLHGQVLHTRSVLMELNEL